MGPEDSKQMAYFCKAVCEVQALLEFLFYHRELRNITEWVFCLSIFINRIPESIRP